MPPAKCTPVTPTKLELSRTWTATDVQSSPLKSNDEQVYSCKKRDADQPQFEVLFNSTNTSSSENSFISFGVDNADNTKDSRLESTSKPGEMSANETAQTQGNTEVPGSLALGVSKDDSSKTNFTTKFIKANYLISEPGSNDEELPKKVSEEVLISQSFEDSPPTNIKKFKQIHLNKTLETRHEYMMNINQSSKQEKGQKSPAGASAKATPSKPANKEKDKPPAAKAASSPKAVASPKAVESPKAPVLHKDDEICEFPDEKTEKTDKDKDKDIDKDKTQPPKKTDPQKVGPIPSTSDVKKPGGAVPDNKNVPPAKSERSGSRHSIPKEGKRPSLKPSPDVKVPEKRDVGTSNERDRKTPGKDGCTDKDYLKKLIGGDTRKPIELTHYKSEEFIGNILNMRGGWRFNINFTECPSGPVEQKKSGERITPRPDQKKSEGEASTSKVPKPPKNQPVDEEKSKFCNPSGFRETFVEFIERWKKNEIKNCLEKKPKTPDECEMAEKPIIIKEERDSCQQKLPRVNFSVYYSEPKNIGGWDVCLFCAPRVCQLPC